MIPNPNKQNKANWSPLEDADELTILKTVEKEKEGSTHLACPLGTLGIQTEGMRRGEFSLQNYLGL